MDGSHIENVLKQVYTDVIRNRLNNSNPFLAKIKSSMSSVYGNKVIFTKAVMPNVYKNYICDLATNIYSIRIPDKVMRACSNGNSTLLVNLLNEQCEGVLKTADKELTRQILSDGSSVITKAKGITEDGNLIVEDCFNLTAGRSVIVKCGDAILIDPAIITEIDYANNIVKFGGNNTFNDYDNITLNEVNPTLLGLKYLFRNKDYLGVERENYTDKPVFSSSSIEELYSKIAQSGDDLGTNLVLCSSNIKRKLTDYLIEHKQNIGTITVGDYNALDVNGIPVCGIRSLRGEDSNKVYALNMDEFEWQVLCDWVWLDDNGRVLRQVFDKPEYEASLVKHSQIICKDLSKQEEITIK